MVSQQKIDELRERARELRKSAVTMIYKAQSGHPGGSLSCADIVAALYFDELNLKPEDPKWPLRDRFILSKGHVCPIQYAALAARGYFDKSVRDTLRREGSILQGHPDMNKTAGIDCSTGSLGQGVSMAAGMALGLKYQHKDCHVYALTGDGELQEGIVWEAAMAAAHYKLDNLTLIVDRNGLQIDGTT